jgi:chromosome segregation ATPase
MSTQYDAVQRNVYSTILSDLSKLRLGDVYSVTASRMQPSMVAMGTQYGVLLAKIFESDSSRSSQLTTLSTINEESSVLFSVADQTVHRPLKCMDDSVTSSSAFDADGWSIDPSQTSKQTLLNSDRVTDLNELKTRLSELESRNTQLENELEQTLTKSEASTQVSEQRENELRAQMTSILCEQQSFCDSTKHELQCALRSMECLQSTLEAKEKSCAEMEVDMKSLRTELETVRLELQGDENVIQNTPPQLADASKAIEILEMRLASKNRYCETLQEEINSLKAANDQMKCHKERGAEIVRDSVSTDVMTDDASEMFDKELSELREKEEYLRKYVELLEQDKVHLDEEIDGYKQKCDRHEREKSELQNTISEQKESLNSLLDLLDKREREYEDKMTRCNEQISVIESKYEELERQLKAETEIAAQAEEKMIATESANANLRKENSRLENEAMQKQALYSAMKYELQNALNELAMYEQARCSK